NSCRALLFITDCFGCLRKVYFDFTGDICDNPPAYTHSWRQREKADGSARCAAQHTVCRARICRPAAGVRCGHECNWCTEQGRHEGHTASIAVITPER